MTQKPARSRKPTSPPPPKSRRGGPRPNSGGARPGSGRKPKAPGIKRVTFSASVAPVTVETIRGLAQAEGTSMGAVVDRLAADAGPPAPGGPAVAAARPKGRRKSG